MVAWYLVVVVLTLVVLFFRLPDPDDVTIYEGLEFAPISPSEKGSTAASSWTHVALPDNWRHVPDRQNGEGLYRGIFWIPAGQKEHWAIHVPTLSSKLFAYVNDMLIGESLPHGAAPALDQPLPLLLPIPPSVLSSGNNELVIQLREGGITGGFLDRVMIGPDHKLRQHHNLRWFAATTLPQLLIVWEIFLFVGMFALWCSRPREVAYGFFCGILAWAILNGLPLIVVDLPLPKTVWSRLTYQADIWQACLAVPFAYHFLNQPRPARLHGLLILPLLVTISAWIVYDAVFELIVLFVVLPAGLICLLWCASIFLIGAFRDGHAGGHLVTSALIAVVAFTAHDILIIYNVIDSHIGFLMRYSFFLVVTCISSIFIQRFIQSLNMVDDLNSSLEWRLASKEQQLKESFTAQRSDERKRDLEHERTRLMQDMHDGLGGHLVSIVSMAERQKASDNLAATARAALDDLRMIVNSLDIDEGDLSTLLGLFRERIERQLSIADLDLDWQMDGLPDIEGLDPSSALQILRILQEAVTNIIKHADARTVRIEVEGLPASIGSGVQIALIDDGRGGIDQRQGGVGLSSMRARAEAIGATLMVQSAHTGSMIRLTLPLCLPSKKQREDGKTDVHPLSMG